MNEGTTEHLPTSTLKISKNLLASKEKPINNTDEELWYKATFDDEPETKNNPETDKDSSSFVCAATLNIEGDEDAPPVAKQFHSESGNTTVISVADGLGGSGARRSETGKTVAYHGSRAAQEAVSSLSESDLNQEILQIKNTIQERLHQKFSSLPKVPESKIKSKLIKDYPTTLSMAILREDKYSKSVKLIWTGDSPIFIFTPEAIYTTATPESGDAPTSSIYRDHYHLDSRELTFDKDTPLMIVVASDGLLKMGVDSIGTAIRFILEHTQNTDPSKISQQMIEHYQQLKSQHAIELDDTTIAITTSGDISKFNDTPIKLIA